MELQVRHRKTLLVNRPFLSTWATLFFLQQRCDVVPLLVVMPAHFKRKGNRLCCITSRIGCNACGKIMVDDHWWIFCSEDSNFIIWDCNFQWMWVNYLFIYFFGRNAWNWFWTEHQYLVGGKWGIAGDFFHFSPLLGGDKTLRMID